MTDIALPYDFYTDEDIAHRTLYVEASRGCPFRCEFCLSSLDKTAWAFDTDLFIDEMEKLYHRGARNFKFVDRTFNLNIKRSLQIIQFFLKKLEAAPTDPVFAHFELVPDHLPDALKEAILLFPAGSLQLEIGVQSFNTDVQSLISRKQDNEKSEENIRWLKEHTHAHMHADLIVGLPGENIDSFAKGFNRLVDINPHEIQVGILKRLRGTPVLRHAGALPPGFRFLVTLYDFVHRRYRISGHATDETFCTLLGFDCQFWPFHQNITVHIEGSAIRTFHGLVRLDLSEDECHARHRS